MDKETKKFIKECDCDLIQKLWKPKVGDRFRYTFFFYYIERDNEVGFRTEGCIWLPSLSQIIELIGDKLITLHGKYGAKEFTCCVWECKDKKEISFFGTTPEIACIKALKQVLKEGK